MSIIESTEVLNFVVFRLLAMTMEFIESGIIDLHISGGNSFKSNRADSIAVRDVHVVSGYLSKYEGIGTRWRNSVGRAPEVAVIKGDIVHFTKLKMSIRLELTVGKGDVVEGEVAEIEIDGVVKDAIVKKNVVHDGLIKGNTLIGVRTEATILEVNIIPRGLGEVVRSGVAILKITFVKQDGDEVGEGEGPCTADSNKLMVLNTEVVIVTLRDGRVICNSLTCVP